MAPLSHVPAFFIFCNFYYYVIIVTPLSHILSFAFAHIAVSWAAPFFKSPAPPTLPGGPQSLGSRVHPGVGSVLWRRRLVRILLVLVTATAVRAGEREREEEGCVCGGGGERARARVRERSSGTVFHKGCFLRAYEQVCAYGFGVERVSHWLEAGACFLCTLACGLVMCSCMRPGHVGVPPSLRTPSTLSAPPLVTLVALVPSMQAVSIPDFSVVMAFIGSLPSNIMAFFLPALFHLIICWRVIGFWGRCACV
jgi:hypothetical protein